MAMGEPPLRRCLVGGTFDRFHIGHEVLLSTALRHAEKIEVWVVVYFGPTRCRFQRLSQRDVQR